MDDKKSVTGVHGCPGADDIKNPKPSYIPCPKCGGDVEVWSGEEQTVCDECGGTVTQEGALACLEWCEKAEECVGGGKYRKYLEQNKIRLVFSKLSG